MSAIQFQPAAVDTVMDGSDVGPDDLHGSHGSLVTPYTMKRETRILVFDMAHPEDFSGLTAALARGELLAADIKTIFIKTEGNGLDNDWSRPLAMRALARCLGESVVDGEMPMVVVSGGCEGILTPHMTVLAVHPSRDGGNGAGALAVGCARSAPMTAQDLGRPAHAQRVREALLAASADAGLDLSEIVHVHVLSPWMGHDLLAVAPADADLVARSAHASKPAIRGAAAIGAGIMLGEINPAQVEWTAHGPLCTRHAQCVAVTAGDTSGHVHVMVLGHSKAWGGRGQVACAQMRDMLDVDAIAQVHRGTVRAAFFKGDPPVDGRVRGLRTTMGADSDIHAFRHFRAAMSGVFGAALGTQRVFIGGGAEYQCNPGGGVLTVLYEIDA